ncbi:uncharacterized membrane protein YidH (DUF202 family) [Rhodoligotrophos appendicifer]|uniref:tripartite tricarboxylate transporter TctB family protein n=1 Tax=Rhodoligotrophos appendicifer TaxID=987056 RepID=UPI00117DFA8D|nr:tripartite tricarboxylate transporter TctB family protein [Rhodoligotrophos appendicifer]
MLTLPRKTLLAGLVCMMLGAFVAWRGYDYSIGNLSHVGAGFFPAVLGLILVASGIGLAIQGLRIRKEAGPVINLRSYLTIPGAVIVFALTINRFGLLPAVALATAISSLADPDMSKRSILFLTIGLMVLTYIVFVLILQIPLTPVMWRP